MKDTGKLITIRFDGRKKESDSFKRSRDALMVRKYMELRNNGLLYESLFPAGIKYHPDIYYDFESYMWLAILPNGDLCRGDLRSMVRVFIGEDVRYHYEVNNEERETSMFEIVVRDAVENPESFDISMYLVDYSEQERDLLLQLCDRLNTCRNGERYSGAKLGQWISR